MTEKTVSEKESEKLREKAVFQIMGLADTQTITVTAVERILREYETAMRMHGTP